MGDSAGSLPTEEAHAPLKEPGRGGIVLRVIGGLLLAGGLLALLDLLNIQLPWGRRVAIILAAKKQAYVLGIWLVQGWPAYLHAGISCALLLFAGVQLLRVRRSGWITALVILAYISLSLFLYIQTRQVERYMEAFQTSRGTDSLLAGILIGEQAYKIERVYRVVAFFAIGHLVLFLYVASEWWRFWKRRGWYASRTLQWVKLPLCLAIVAAHGVWTFWGADYVSERAILQEALEPRPDITGDKVDRLSLNGKRRLAATLIRRVAAEKSKEMVEAGRYVGLGGDLSLLTAEDIPAIVEAAGAPALEVREVCYSILGEMGTKEAENCLVEALSNEKEKAAWWAARESLTRIGPSKAPDVVFELAKKNADDKNYVTSILDGFKDPRAIPILVEISRCDDPRERKRAVGQLRGHPGQESERALRRALEDSDDDVRFGACAGLHAIGTADSIPRLIDFLKGPDREYQMGGLTEKSSFHSDLASALAGITGKEFGEDAEKWESWWKESKVGFELQKSLIERLFTPLPSPPTDPPKSLEEIRSHPYMKAAMRQSYAIRGIRGRNLRGLAPELARHLALPEEQAPWKFVTAQLLTEWGYREGIEWLIEWVDNDVAEGNRMFAIRALGRACGVNFFSDKARWREWWAKNKHRFPSAKAPQK